MTREQTRWWESDARAWTLSCRGLLTLSSRRILMASLRLSDFPLPILPLSKCRDKSNHANMRAAARKGEGYSHLNDALILSVPLHVVVCIVSKLEYVR